ncbi:class I SAM-dependent methyltransferase [Mesorhizobium sp. 1B3]|uniref:class I SAM-dependent methyltransferase n=1 Tax=Mesorhizobium sp. 1B3 TaxID=3243599 RepID=UPI003D95B610
MADKVPDRLSWAAEVVAPGPADRILEIGCGHGVLLSLLADRLTSGTITALDRSDKMVAAATKRNAPHIASGKAVIRQAELSAADFKGRLFDKIVAVRVNVFWMDPARELAAVRRLLEPSGLFYLFFDPPSPTQAEPIAAKLTANLESNGFRVLRKAFTVIGAGKGVCVVAEPS